MKSRYGKLISIMIIIVMVSLLVTACGGSKPAAPTTPAAPAAPTEYKLGFLAPMTGDCSFWGIRCKEAVELAVEKVNAAGGINGVKLVVDYNDTRGEKTDVANIVQKYASDPKILGILGSVLSGDMFVGGPIADKAGVVMCGFATTATGIPQIGKYVFRVATTGAIGSPAMMAYAQEKYKVNSVAIFSSLNNDYSVGARKDFQAGAAKLGMKVVADETYNDKDTNFSAQISKIVKAQPDAIIFAGYATEGSLAAVEARKQGFKGLFMGGDGMIDIDNLKKIGGKATEGMLLFGGYNAGYDNPLSKEFVQKFTAKYGHEPESAAAGAYDAALIMAEALKKSGPDRAKLQAAFAETKNFKGVGGDISFDANREVVKTTFIFEYKDGNFNLLGTK